MSNLTTIGLLVIMLTVGGSIQQFGGAHSLGSYGPLVGLIGVIVGASITFLGVKMTGSPTSVSLRAMALLTKTYLRHNLSMLGLFAVSSALMVHVVAGTAIGLALSIGLFVMLLLGVAMITLGVHGSLTSWTN